MGQTATDCQILWTAGEGFVIRSTRDEKKGQLFPQTTERGFIQAGATQSHNTERA